MILITAWKNVWRNRTRSLVVISSVTIGIFAGIFAVGLMNGTIEQRVDAALNQEISHIQISQQNFRDNFDIQLVMQNYPQMNKKILDIEGVESIANRTIINGIANTAAKSAGVQIIGVNPDQEKRVFSLHEKVIPGTGDYFEKTTRYNQAFIGEELAKELNIIRYRLNRTTLDSLLAKGVPREVTNKLQPLIGKRFPSQKAFSNTVKNTLSDKYYSDFGPVILHEAWSFRSRSKLTLTFMDKNNYQTGAMFRISGIYDIANSSFEKTQIFILNEDLTRLTGLNKGNCHLSIVKISDRDKAKEIKNKIAAIFPESDVKTWKEISPDIAMMIGMIEKFNIVFMIIILLALSFGIVNTMLMVVLERTKELGMLTAIGMNKKKVFTMIMAESVFLSLVGGIVGMFISKLVLMFTSLKGINIEGAAEGFEEMGFSSQIFPTISNTFFISVTILVVITGILSSIYPAIKALKLDPSEALRTE